MYKNKYQTGGLQHLRAFQIRREIGDEIFSDYFKFSIVRNPYDRAVSGYSYTKKQKFLRAYLGMSEGDEFKRYLELIQLRDHVQWMPQYKFLFDDDGKLLVDFYGRFERFSQECKKVLRRLGLPEKAIPHEMRSDRTHYTDYYDDESVDMVAALYEKDIELFSYEF